jgi:hypothetical protein
VHKTAAWVYCSDNWYRSRSFPLATATWIRDAGSVPFIRLMLLDSAARKPNKRFTLAHVPRGDFDADFRTWGRAAQAFDTPLIVEFRDRGEQLLVPVERQPAHDTDMRVQDNPRLADAFRTLVGANANVLGRVGH